MKTRNVIRIVIFLMLLILVVIVVQTSKRADEERKKEVLSQQLQEKSIDKLKTAIDVAERREDYYSVVKLSKELLNTGYTNNLINLKITHAEQKIVELKLAPIASKAKELYKRIETLKGVIPYYTLQIESIDGILENAKDYEFSQDYNSAIDGYLDVIKQCHDLQTLEVKRLSILKNRRNALRLNMNIETSFKSEANSNNFYKEGQEYLKRAELAYQLAKFNVAQSDYNAAVSKMKQSLDFLTQQKEFNVAQQRWNSKVFNAVKAAKVDSVDEFYEFLELYSADQWTNLKSEIFSAELVASTNNFSEAVIIYRNSIIAFDDVLKTANVNKEKVDKKKVEEENNAEELKSEEPLSVVENVLNDKLVINADKPFDIMLSTNVMISMLPIKSGSCSLGDYVEKGDKQIQYKIVITENFWCSKSETTLAMFLEFLKAEGIQNGIEISQFGPFVKNKENKLVLSKNKYSRFDGQPVFGVDWNIALKFCEWLNEISKDKRPSNYIFRLPTEAEWIYSAMYEGDTTDEVTLSSIAWYSKNSSSTSHRVCSLKPNEFGLCDMYGNVWEWCFDSYSPDFIKSNQPVSTNLVCSAVTNKRVVKGGSWDFTEKALKPLGNMGFDKSAKQNAIGFRVVLAPQI
jgi:formylglycine-generating enzyme required for sulfatase activity